MKIYLSRLPTKPPVSFEKLYPNTSTKAVDLLEKMLILDPKERIAVEDALAHPFLSKYHDVDDEPACFPPFDFDFEQVPFSKEKLREAVAKEIHEFHTSKLERLLPFPRAGDNDEGESVMQKGSGLGVDLCII